MFHLNRSDARNAAVRAVEVAHLHNDRGETFGGFMLLNALDYPLAEFLERQPDASAETLYRYAQSIAPGARSLSWSTLPPWMRVGLEIFRASFLALMVLVREGEAAKAEKQRGELGRKRRGMGERETDRVDGDHDRVVLRRRSTSAPAPAARSVSGDAPDDALQLPIAGDVSTAAIEDRAQETAAPTLPPASAVVPAGLAADDGPHVDPRFAIKETPAPQAPSASSPAAAGKPRNGKSGRK